MGDLVSTGIDLLAVFGCLALGFWSLIVSPIRLKKQAIKSGSVDDDGDPIYELEKSPGEAQSRGLKLIGFGLALLAFTHGSDILKIIL